MHWYHRTEVVYQPARREDSPQDRYLKVLETRPFSEEAGRHGYWLGMHEDRAQALILAKRLASDPEPGNRFAGAAALARLHCDGSREGERALWKLVEDECPQVRMKVAEELRWDSLPETGRLKLALAKDPHEKVRALVASGLYHHEGDEYRDVLLSLVRDPSGEVRANALQGIESIEPDDTRPPVSDFFYLAKDPCEDVRCNLAEWLRWSDPTMAFPVLLPLLRDPDSGVRLCAVKAIASNEGPEATDLLLAATEDEYLWIRSEALRALSSRKYPDALSLHLRHEKDPSGEVRKVVAGYLESHATEEHLPILEKFSEDDANVYIRHSTLRALGRIPGIEAETLIVRMLKDPAKLVSKAAKKLLERRAKDDGVSVEAANLVRFGTTEAVATRLAFRGRSDTPLKAWNDFLGQVQRLDGRISANSKGSPVVQFDTTNGGQYCIFPFGPAHWIRLQCVPEVAGAPTLAYDIQTTAEIQAWFPTAGIKHWAHGLRLAKALGWVKA